MLCPQSSFKIVAVMNKNENNSANYLADLLVKVGTKNNGSQYGLNYCWAYGTLTALFDQARFGNAQGIIDSKILQLEKELGI